MHFKQAHIILINLSLYFRMFFLHSLGNSLWILKPMCTSDLCAKALCPVGTADLLEKKPIKMFQQNKSDGLASVGLPGDLKHRDA